MNATSTELESARADALVQRGRRQLRQLLTECCRVQTSPTGGVSDYEPGASCEDDPAAPGRLRCRSGCR